jgi:hypothetical protein
MVTFCGVCDLVLHKTSPQVPGVAHLDSLGSPTKMMCGIHALGNQQRKVSSRGYTLWRIGLHSISYDSLVIWQEGCTLVTRSDTFRQ